MVPALPQARQAAGLWVGKDGRAVDDARARRIGERDLDDVYPEEGGALS